jgi:hypothetical protein
MEGKNVKVKVKVKLKLKLFLCFNLAPRHEGVLKWMYSSTHSLTSASRSGHFPREGAPGTHWIGGLLGPREMYNIKLDLPCI